MIIEELTKKYSLAPDSYYTESPYGKDNDGLLRKEHEEKYYIPFRDKWDKHTEKGWYGARGLSFPLPIVFYSVLDDFLEYVKKECPDFKLLQAKIKFGGVRLHLDNITPKVEEECYQLEDLLFDKFLIY